MSYFNHFTRPKMHVSTKNYNNHLVTQIEETENNESAKYQALFSDSFGHHVQFNLNEAPIKVQLNNVKRFITTDSLTSYFIDNLYTPPSIYESQNTRLHNGHKRSFEYFLRRISDTPITSESKYNGKSGSNNITFLIGDVGTGKTLLISKAVRELKRKERESSSSSKDSSLLLVVYFDFEVEMKGDGGHFQNIDDAFYGKLTHAVYRSIENTSTIYSRRSERQLLQGFNYPTELARFISTIRELHLQNIRVLLVLDNLDGYHYPYSEYAFFPEYRVRLVQSIQRNITGLNAALQHGEQLGMLGLSIVIAARRYVYEDCLHTIEPETSAEFNGTVFQLDETNEIEVVAKRLSLLEIAITEIESEPRLKKFGEEYKIILNRLRVLFGIRDAANLEIPNPKSIAAMKMLRNLCRHGHRDLVTFLSNLHLDHKEESDLIERFFWDKPHTLVLLYITNLRERYTQAHGHFPNIFLVDSLVSRNEEFSQAHLPHTHTYWLKYLILAYVANKPDHIASTKEIVNLFVDIGGYERGLVLLTLGSLSASRQSRCIEPLYAEKDIPSTVIATDRGKFLVFNCQEYGSVFCFTFTYLQLIVDDYLMSYPKVCWHQIYSKDINLEYLFSKPNDYASLNGLYLEQKMKNVLAFLFLMRVAYEEEFVEKTSLINNLKLTSPSILPDFSIIEQSIMKEYQKITNHLPNGEKLYNDLQKYKADINKDESEVHKAIERYYKQPVQNEA